MKNMLRQALLVAVALCMSPVALCNDLPGVWILQVQNPKHQVVATLNVQFTDAPAKSCMSGNWKVLRVLSAKANTKGFFPVSDPLSYQIENGQLTIGRTEVCDGYLQLQASLGGRLIQGDYFSLGLGGSSPLGYFKLSRPK